MRVQNPLLAQLSGKVWGYQTVAAKPSPATKPPPATMDFVVWPDTNAKTSPACKMNDNGTSQSAYVFCWQGGDSWPPSVHTKFGLDGVFDQTTMIPEPMGLGGPALKFGHSTTIARCRCSSAAAGLTCIVIKDRQGPPINDSGITPIG